MIKILTLHVTPPVPTRCFDWTAYGPDYEPGDPVGHGVTQQEAVEEYLAAIDAPLDAKYVVEKV